MVATEEGAGARAEKPMENHAWILLFVSSAWLTIYATIVLAIVGLTGRTFSDKTWDEYVALAPGMAPFFVNSATSIFGLGFLGMAMSAFSFRKGERWAWYALWYLPAFAIVGEIVDIIILSGHAYSFIVVAILSLMGLLLPFRKFFPRNG